VTYGEVARMVGTAPPRAVGGGDGAEPDPPIVVPCHRVVAKAGIGGFSPPDLAIKKTLLALERRGGDVCTPEKRGVNR
ncbi:MGMT family protein, partial [Methanoculleus chikugoensis]|uniref:MGMT family protein n=1 Tax=Methanoculleus chikugoensis TaxID=118126 RepID=UPI000AC96944